MQFDIPDVRLAPSQPASTFAERGVAIPFTTPLLAGARVRQGKAARSGACAPPELVMLNPAGSRGLYIVPWDAARQLARPTIHDDRLYKLVIAAGDFTPAGVAEIAAQVAMEGYAGRPARAAASASANALSTARLQGNFQLLAMLIRQEGGALPAGLDTAAAVQAAGRALIGRLAPAMGLRPVDIAAALELLAAATARLGIVGPASRATPARLTIRRLLALAAAAETWASANTGPTGDVASMIAVGAGLAATGAGRLIANAASSLADLCGLIARAAASPAKVVAEFARADWVLDGWDQPCALHQDAADQSLAPDIVREMAALCPVMPDEASDWLGMAAEFQALARLRGVLAPVIFARSGAPALDLVARNEALRAACLNPGALNAGVLNVGAPRP